MRYIKRYILALILALSFTPAFAGTVEKTGDYTIKITTTEKIVVGGLIDMNEKEFQSEVIERLTKGK